MLSLISTARYFHQFTKLNTNNFFLQIHPDEIDDDAKVMLIWDFTIPDLSLTASHCSVKAKIPLSVSPIDSFMPPLDLSRVTCNCVNSSLNGKVLLVLSCTESRTISEINFQMISLLDVHEENACEEEEEDRQEEEGEDDDDFADASGSSRKELFAPESTECPPTEPLHTERQLISRALSENSEELQR